MKKTSLTLAASLFSLILAGCSSSGGVPEEYRTAVMKAKTIKDPLDELESEFIDNALGIEAKLVRIDGQVVPNGPYRFSDLEDGLNTLPIEVEYGPEPGSNNQKSGTISGTLFIYEQPYSMVLSSLYTQDTGNLMGADDFNVHYVEEVMGLETKRSAIDTLSTAGTVATYTGGAFNGKQQQLGNLTYEVNFGTRVGSGTITGLTESGTVKLLPSDIIGNEIGGEAEVQQLPNTKFYYELEFFGPKAEEIAGSVWTTGAPASEIGFAGARPMP